MNAGGYLQSIGQNRIASLSDAPNVFRDKWLDTAAPSNFDGFHRTGCTGPGLRADACRRITPNWKNFGFHKHPIAQPLTSRDALEPRHAISRLLGQFETFRASRAATASRDLGLAGVAAVANPAIRAPNEQGPPVGTDGPCVDRDELRNSTKWRRRESNPRPATFPRRLLRV